MTKLPITLCTIDAPPGSIQALGTNQPPVVDGGRLTFGRSLTLWERLRVLFGRRVVVTVRPMRFTRGGR